MATYNGSEYLKEQVDSILVQLSDDDELVVSDDGSADSTIEILQSYNDPRIKIHHNIERKGVIGNFENALSKSIGDYIFLSDQDDVWAKDKVKLCLKKLENCDLVLHDAQGWDGENFLWESFFSLRGAKKGYWQNLLKNGYIGCCMAFTNKLKSVVLPFPKSISMHDVYIGLVAERKFRVKFIDHALIKYRRHSNNASPTGEKSSYSIMHKCKSRINLLIYTLTK